MKRALEEFELVKYYDYVVVNHDGKANEAAKAIYEIVIGEQHKVSRSEGAIEKIFFENK
jgi:guanylate kinase